MDLLITILMFAAIAFLNASKTKKEAEARRRRQIEKQRQTFNRQSPTGPQAPGQDMTVPGKGRMTGQSVRELAEQPAVKELAKQFGVDEMLEEFLGQGAREKARPAAAKPSAKRKGQPLQGGPMTPLPASKQKQPALREGESLEGAQVQPRQPLHAMESTLETHQSSLQSHESRLSRYGDRLTELEKEGGYSGEGPRPWETAGRTRLAEPAGSVQKKAAPAAMTPQQVFANGLLWSQILGEPRSRRPYSWPGGK